jgi:O-succinylbenzoate synthase
MKKKGFREPLVISKEFPFKQPAGTSRGVYMTRKCNYLFLSHDGKHWGVGEFSPLPGLSIEKSLDYNNSKSEDSGCCGMCKQSPSFDFAVITCLMHEQHGGIECSEKDIKSGRVFDMHFPAEQWIIYDTPFTRGEEGIQINGLVWMGTLDEMKARAQAKIDAGYRCIKVKIGALHFEEELELLRYIRQQRSPEELELRVDANGAFTPEEAPEKLRRLAEFSIHSIEQPIRAGQWEAMGELVKSSPIPIALDEELIGVSDNKSELLRTIHPDYLIIKPTLIGVHNFFDWFQELASEDFSSDFWFTSALESNVGLNAIAQLVGYLKTKDDSILKRAQGLGTGQLFTSNWDIPLTIEGDTLYFKR